MSTFFIMQLTTEIKENIYLNLGYTFENIDYQINTLDRDFYVNTVNRILQIFNELDEIDNNLVGARTDSMATKLDTIGLDYKQHVKHLCNEGTRLLWDLANISGIPLMYDRYSKRYGNGFNNNCNSNNYW